MSANSSQDDGGESGVWLRVRILNSFVFSLRTTVRAIRDSLREADQSFSASLRSRSKHEGESSASLCDRLGRTREISQRQLPTDHDYAVPTREYQTDQSSLNLPRLLLALSSRRSKGNYKNIITDFAELTRSLHIRAFLW